MTYEHAMKTYEGFTECYHDLLRLTYDEPHHVCKPGQNRPAGRGGGQEIRERLCQGFVLQNPRDRLANCPERNLSVSYAVAELLWYLIGSDSTEWISYYAPFWRGITDDGQTANSAYGARIFGSHHPRVHGSENAIGQSQWEYVRQELKNDPESRRAVIHIRSAADSWLAKKDVPCTIALQFFLRAGQLHLVTMMRSSDLILGIPYDVFAFTVFQELMALELGMELGTYMHVSNSAHVYERDFEMVKRILAAPAPTPLGPMPIIPRMPPTIALALGEEIMRQKNTAGGIVSMIDETKYAVIDDWYVDVLKVLGSNRAGKLGLKTLQRGLLDSTRWSGYASFVR